MMDYLWRSVWCLEVPCLQSVAIHLAMALVCFAVVIFVDKPAPAALRQCRLASTAC